MASPDPTIDLHWGDYRGAIHEIFAKNAKSFPDRDVELVVAYMGALKAGATVSVIDPQYPPERQTVLLDVAKPRFLVCIEKANEEFGPPSDLVLKFASDNLSLKSTIPALELLDNGELRGGSVNGKDTLDPSVYSREDPTNVLIGPDSIPTLSFTSGSEGRPKGVQGRHFSLTHYFPWMAERFGLSDQDRFTMLSGIAHDPIQRDIFTPLFLGAKIICPPAEAIAYEVLAEWMKENSVTVTHLTPAMGQILVGGATAQIPSLRNAFFVGDLLTKKDTNKLRNLAPNTSVINLYGSTESQRAVSYFEIPSRAREPLFLDTLPDIIPVGQGMQNVQLLVVDRDDRSRLCQVGEQGELMIRAAGLSEGYLGDDEKTASLNRDKFLLNWFVDPTVWAQQDNGKSAAEAYKPWGYKGPRDRLYRTGDLGRRREDGNVECTGRIDSQVKIRGFRIELGEIDTHLSQHPFVRENVTLVRRDKDEEHTLVTYFVPETKRWFEHVQKESGQLEPVSQDESMGQMLRKFKSLSEDCKKYLATKVPKYAVPSLFIPLAHPNGKIDRPALPFPDAADLSFLAKRRASSVSVNLTPTQTRLASIWASVLPNSSARMFRPESNFFDEGGHSILAQQMFFSVTKEWKDINLPIKVIFQSQTLEALAAEIDRAQDPIGLRLDAMPLDGDKNVLDEAYAADARDLTSKIPKSIPTAGAVTSPRVLLTGATGFLGSYIVRELLEGPTKANVIALVRAKDPADGLARLEKVMTAYGLWSQEWVTSSRLEVVVGDIGKPQLGLSQDVWARLSAEVDAVIHNGAQVNWMLPYSSLRSANVLSTLACIQLCATGKAKRLAFVSSTSTLDNDHYVELSKKTGAVMEADDLEGSRKGLATGYGQSKWASELLVREAGLRGLAGAVIRPGYITADPASGISVTDDFLVRLWKGSLQVGGRPDITNTLNAVPVTQVSRIVVSSAFHLSAATGQSVAVAQVTSHPRLTLNDWIGALEVYGYEAPIMPYPEWSAKVKEYVSDDTKEEPHALLPLFHFVVGDLPGNSIAPELDDANALAALKLYENESNVSHAVDVQSLGAYLAYLVAIGFLPPPTGSGKTPLPKLDLAASQISAASSFGGRSAKP
ncbi:L-2-aminoadipate reductase large subunit [Trichoderma asperellum]|uniref:Alpha-aminoadipate reductase n=1 Tax=Trichoderma asperellum TaxID=101201 RepID=A0A6V8QPW6_TRIAP|nr:L-2-aminoadipate reductase large subunit [Trichoderma asperellum]